MKMFQTKVVEKIKTQFYVQYFFPENRVVYEIMWKNGGAREAAYDYGGASDDG